MTIYHGNPLQKNIVISSQQKSFLEIEKINFTSERKMFFIRVTVVTVKILSPYFYRLTVTQLQKMFSQWDLSGDSNFQGDDKN